MARMTHITMRQGWSSVGYVARGTANPVDPQRPNLAMTTPPRGRNEDFHRDPLPAFIPLAFVTRGRRLDRGAGIPRGIGYALRNMHAAPGIAAKLDRFRGHRG
jgi:hypothetical protein